MKVIGIIAMVLSVIMWAGFASAINVTDTISIEVEVSELTMVDVNPTSLSWSGTEAVPPGGEGNEKAIQIENIGSTNITAIWFNNTYPSSRPFGTGGNASYDAGNFVAIRRNSTNERYYFPNRVDYNESQILIYLNVPSGYKYGRFRNSSYEYFWAVTEGASGNCTDGTFKIGKTPHTQTQTGSTDLTTCDPSLTGTGLNPCREGSLTPATEPQYAGMWGWADLYVGPNDDYVNYTVAVNAYCNETIFFRWNIDAPGGQASLHAQPFTTQTLVPGASVIANIVVRVPYGVVYGYSSPGTLTVIASSQSNS